jgi:hypothetical protein
MARPSSDHEALEGEPAADARPDQRSPGVLSPFPVLSVTMKARTVLRGVLGTGFRPTRSEGASLRG